MRYFIGLGLMAAAAGGCAADPDPSSSLEAAGDVLTQPAEVSAEVAGENTGAAQEESIAGALCDGLWTALSVVGCGIVQSACVAGSTFTLSTTEIPCALAASVACGYLSIDAAVRAHGCPE